MNTVRAMKSPRASIPLSPNTIRQTKGSRVRSPAGSQRTGGDYDGKVSGRPRSARLERANEPRLIRLRHKPNINQCALLESTLENDRTHFGSIPLQEVEPCRHCRTGPAAMGQGLRNTSPSKACSLSSAFHPNRNKTARPGISLSDKEACARNFTAFRVPAKPPDRLQA